jgi:hypothetical protein
MARRKPLIYGGGLTADDLIGEPDLLEWTGNGYIPGDIKSGSGFEGDENEGRFKKHYAFQRAHYVFFLERIGLAAPDRSTYIVDRDGRRVAYPSWTLKELAMRQLGGKAILRPCRDSGDPRTGNKVHASSELSVWLMPLVVILQRSP